MRATGCGGSPRGVGPGDHVRRRGGDLLRIIPRHLITGRRVTGTSFGGVKGRSRLPGLVDRWLAGEFDAMALISHRLTLDQVHEGFALMEAQDGIRSVIQFS